MNDKVPEKIGRYEIQGVLGQGSMGLVYKAYDPRLQRYAAIKVMSMARQAGDELLTRFFHEAQSAAKLNHEDIISIYDLGEEDDQPFIAMEYLEGEDLKTLIEKKTMSFEQKLGFVIQVCGALDYAHRHDVVHRDIKPGNIFITFDGRLKILDFGLARLSSSEMTGSGVILGSPYYMSPEQVKGQRDVDGRSDLFNVGVVLYELIACRRPFEGDTPTSVCFQIVNEPHEPISEIFPGCAPELVRIVDQALSKDREGRYQSGLKMAADLERFRDQLSTVHEALKRSVETLRKKLRYLVDRGLLEPKEADVSQIDSSTDEDDYGSLLVLHTELKRRSLKFLQRQPDSGAEEGISDALDATQQVDVEAMDLKVAEPGERAVEPTRPSEEPQTVEVKPTTRTQPFPSKTPARVTVAPGKKPRLVWLAAGLAVVLLVLAVGMWWNGSLSWLGNRGSLILNVAPWARVDSIIRADSGEPISVEENLTTPCVVSLPPGRYRVRVSNPYFNEPLEFEVSVTAGEPSRVYKQLPDFDPEKELSEAIEMQSGS